MSGSGSGGGWAELAKSLSISYDVNKTQEMILNGVVTPVVSHAMTHLNESYTYNKPSPISVYPSVWTEELFERLIEEGYAEVGWGETLEWNMKEDTNAPFDEMTHMLACTFQWVYLPPAGEDSGMVGAENGLYLLRNVAPYCECSDTGWGWDVRVDIDFEDVAVVAGKAQATVAYHLVSKESDGDLFRDVMRKFEIKGDGSKTQIA
jgi:hypothetical protein